MADLIPPGTSLNAGRNAINNKIADMDKRVNRILESSGDSNAETKDARYDKEQDVYYNLLGDRLDALSRDKETKEEADQKLALKADKLFVDNAVETIEIKVDALASGAPKGVYATVAALQTAFPSGNSNNYIVSADGKWYYWNGSAWTAGTVYQSMVLADGSVTLKSLAPTVGKNIPENWIEEVDILYGIADEDGRVVLSIDQTGAVTIHQLKTNKPIDFPDNSIEFEKIKGMESADSEASGLLWGITDNEGRLSELVLDQEGQIPQRVLDQWRTRMNTEDTSITITCWGDSLTAGAGGNGTTYPSVLQGLSGLQVFNMGVGGETSSTIVSRQGGSTMMVNDLTIPAAKQKIQIFSTPNTRFTDNAGRTCSPLRQGPGGVNPCYIAGVKGTLSITQTTSTSTDVLYFFEREVAGTSDTIINRPTPIITDAMVTRRNDILVIFAGQNGGWSDPGDLCNQIKSIVDYASFNKPCQYIVVGLHSLTAADRAPLESEMLKQFGRRYINLRDYMTKYGLSDAGITPTSQDTADMAAGKTPTSLMTDGVHFTAAGYTIIGNLIFKRLKELSII